MEVGRIRFLIDGGQLADVAACRAELVAITSVRAMLAQRELRVTQRLDELSADTEGELATHTKGTASKAGKVRRRKQACDDVPQLGEALAEGETTEAHVDAVARALADLSAADRARLAEHGDAIRAKAASSDEATFREWLTRKVREVRTEDGLKRLERQKAAARAKTWLDQDGMFNLHARFDPETGIGLKGRLNNTIEALFHGRAPEGAPLDPFERQQWLAALALAALIKGEGSGGSGVPDITVVIDATTLLHGEHAGTRLDLGQFGLPVETIRRWACLGDITPVIVGVDGTRLLLGRTERLANREQRRALRTLYRTCACCDVLFEHCEIHHVIWFDPDGRSDIDNMLPLCHRHHHLAHEGGWQLALHTDRTLRITLPNGEVRVHSPPRAKAA
jgi:hypothetical protein